VAAAALPASPTPHFEAGCWAPWQRIDEFIFEDVCPSGDMHALGLLFKAMGARASLKALRGEDGPG
jgi:hypothetical protein